MSDPVISIVIPARDAAATLGPLLAALSPQVRNRPEVEVVVVNSGSRDATPDLARRAGVRVVPEAGTGPAGARNAGLSAVRGDLVVFLDSDCIPRDDWLALLTEPMLADPGLGALGGHVAAAKSDNLVSRHATRMKHVSQEVAFGDLYLPYLITANCCYRRGLLDALGGFDAQLANGEDADLAWRAQKEHGARIEYTPDAVVEHVHRTTLGGLWRQSKVHGWAEVQLQARHGVQAGTRADGRRPVRRLLGDLVASARAAALVPMGRATTLEVVSPLLRSFERLAARVGRIEAHRARARGRRS